MADVRIAATIAGLIDRVERLEAEKAALSAENAGLHERVQSCGRSVAGLVKRVEDLQSRNAELTLETARSQRTSKPEYRRRPPVMRGRTVQANVGCGPLYITLNEDEQGRPFEVFFKLGKSGSCQQSYLEALGVAMSVGLRYGADPEKFVEKFEGMRCPNPKMRDATGPSTLSCADGISQGLANAIALTFPSISAEKRSEADVVAVAEPRVAVDPIDALEETANARSIDLTAMALPLRAPASNGNGHANGNGHGTNGGSAYAATLLDDATRRKAMRTGVGMCPKCGGNLISQGGCIQCLQQCGYVGKCS